MAYAYIPVTLTKRVLLRPVQARQDVMVRRFWDKWGGLRPAARAALREGALWVHMNSGGEVVMAEGLLRRLRASGRRCVFSTESHDARALLARWYGEEHVFFPPWDTRAPVARTLRGARPAAMLFITNAYFPRLLQRARRLGIRTLLVNGLLSRNVAVANPPLERALALGVLGALDAVGAQTAQDVDAFRQAGVPADRIAETGRLEGDLVHLRLSAPERAALRRELGLAEGTPALIVGSLPPQEEAVVLEAFRALRAAVPNARLLIAPRWLHDVPGVVGRFGQAFRVVTRTGLQNGAAGSAYDVLVIDTFGELRRLYGAADAAFLGSSLVPINARKGGHNVLEPLAHGMPTFFGPHMNLWQAVTEELCSVWPGLRVESAAALGERAAVVFTGQAPVPALGAAAARIVARDAGALERTMAFIQQELA